MIDVQTRDAIEQTIKAGILEQGTVDLMRQTGVGDRMMRDGFVHHGINLAFRGGMHRINLTELSGGRSVMVYAQHEVLKDLIAKRVADGGDVRFGVTDTKVDDFLTEQPKIRFTHEGKQESLECDFVIGADGSRTMCRFLIPQPEVRTDFFRQYPFAWFGILAEAPPSSDELIYAHSDRGFVLVSTRSPSVQRLYFQCDPETDTDDLVGRPDLVGVRGAPRRPPEPTITPGNIFRKDVLQFRVVRLRADAVRPAVPGGRLRPHRAADRGQGPEPGDGRRARPRPRAGGVLPVQGHRAAGVLHRRPLCAGCGGRSGSRSG